MSVRVCEPAVAFCVQVCGVVRKEPKAVLLAFALDIERGMYYNDTGLKPHGTGYSLRSSTPGGRFIPSP